MDKIVRIVLLYTFNQYPPPPPISISHELGSWVTCLVASEDVRHARISTRHGIDDEPLSILFPGELAKEEERTSRPRSTPTHTLVIQARVRARTHALAVN